MNQEELRAFTALLMICDPWPIEEPKELLDAAADRMARALGFTDWIEAYNYLY